MKASIQASRGLSLAHSLAGDAVLSTVLVHPLIKALYALPKGIRLSKPYQSFLHSHLGKAASSQMLRMLVDEDELTYVLGLASLAKFAASDNAMMVTSRALELMGTGDCPERRWVEKCYRDAKLPQIYEGTNQLNRLVAYDIGIAKTLRIDLPRPFQKIP